MQETLGKRIAFHRKDLGLTQDQLAEKIGVTAQAVSKWENDQSCPDITTLPKLADIFSITTDELLGVEPRKMVAAEAVREEADDAHLFSVRMDDDKDGRRFEFHYDAGRKGGIGLALWILLTAGLLFLSELRYNGSANLWNCLWSSGLLVFGLFGLYPKFSVLHLFCALFGGYHILSWWMPVTLNKGLWLALFLLLFGLSLLADALRKNNKGGIRIHGPKGKMVNRFEYTEEGFECATCFGENHRRITCARLAQGEAEVSFGELTVDLGGCETFAPECSIRLCCSFGELRLLVPRSCRVVHTEDRAFADVKITGHPAPDAANTIRLDCDVSFGEISVAYV